MTRRHRAPQTTGSSDPVRRTNGARRSWLRWPTTVLPALLLTTSVGLSAGGMTGTSSSSAPLVDITVTGAEQSLDAVALP